MLGGPACRPPRPCCAAWPACCCPAAAPCPCAPAVVCASRFGSAHAIASIAPNTIAGFFMTGSPRAKCAAATLPQQPQEEARVYRHHGAIRHALCSEVRRISAENWVVVKRILIVEQNELNRDL